MVFSRAVRIADSASALNAHGHERGREDLVRRHANDARSSSLAAFQRCHQRCAVATETELSGNPAKPMTRDAHIAKFLANAVSAARPLREDQARALVDLIDSLENIDDVTTIVDHVIG